MRPLWSPPLNSLPVPPTNTGVKPTSQPHNGVSRVHLSRFSRLRSKIRAPAARRALFVLASKTVQISEGSPPRPLGNPSQDRIESRDRRRPRTCAPQYWHPVTLCTPICAYMAQAHHGHLSSHKPLPATYKSSGRQIAARVTRGPSRPCPREQSTVPSRTPTTSSSSPSRF